MARPYILESANVLFVPYKSADQLYVIARLPMVMTWTSCVLLWWSPSSRWSTQRRTDGQRTNVRRTYAMTVSCTYDQHKDGQPCLHAGYQWFPAGPVSCGTGGHNPSHWWSGGNQFHRGKSWYTQPQRSAIYTTTKQPISQGQVFKYTIKLAKCTSRSHCWSKLFAFFDLA